MVCVLHHFFTLCNYVYLFAIIYQVITMFLFISEYYICVNVSHWTFWHDISDVSQFLLILWYSIYVTGLWLQNWNNFQFMRALGHGARWCIYAPIRCLSLVQIVADRLFDTNARFMGPTWAPPEADGPRLVPGWPHEPCYLEVISMGRVRLRNHCFFCKNSIHENSLIM